MKEITEEKYAQLWLVYDKYKHLRPVIVDPKFDEFRSQILRDLFLAIEEICK